MVTLSAASNERILERIAADINAKPAQVQAAVDLLDGGATVPFIARYRKEVTQGLDDVQLRTLQERLEYLRELEERRHTVLKSITDQGKLTPTLSAAIDAADHKQALEDLYAPFKPKRRTKAMIAREAGLQPLADALWADPSIDPAERAASFINAEAGFADAQAVLDGVRDLWSEAWAEDATLVGALREWMWAEGQVVSKLAEGKDANAPEVAKFRDYFDRHESIRAMPSHRALAVLRGRAQEVLNVSVVVAEALALEAKAPHPAEARIARHVQWQFGGRAGDALIRKSVAWTWRVKLALSLERDVLTRLREGAEGVAIDVFGNNLRDVLLAAPAGKRVVMGLDPGIRTGVKVAVVGATGRVEATATVYPHEPRRDWEGAKRALLALAMQHKVSLIAIGNGTASRETDQLAADVLAGMAVVDAAHAMQKLVVSEAGASVYSASAYASEELPDLDVSLRGAVSIARRVQDPLAELVKIEPKSIGVGQYQHDVSQARLGQKLDAIVEDCVNAVGVDLNTASAPLLTRVSGVSSTVANAIVRWRDANGAFNTRSELLKVPGLGPKAFEQAAGFLRIRGGAQPLDASGVHPESYAVVERMLAATKQPIDGLMGNQDVLRSLKPEAFATDGVGAITVRDIVSELAKPGRDPRGDFAVARFNDGIHTLADLKPGLWLEGTVSNVAPFGAFVDLGVHQDGLVHVSQLADRFVQDPHKVVKAGDRVRVRVVEVDAARKRIALSMRTQATSAPAAQAAQPRSPSGNAQRPGPTNQGGTNKGSSSTAGTVNAMAAAFDRLKRSN